MWPSWLWGNARFSFLPAVSLPVVGLLVVNLPGSNDWVANLRVRDKKFIVAVGFRRRMLNLPMEIS